MWTCAEHPGKNSSAGGVDTLQSKLKSAGVEKVSKGSLTWHRISESSFIFQLTSPSTKFFSPELRQSCYIYTSTVVNNFSSSCGSFVVFDFLSSEGWYCMTTALICNNSRSQLGNQNWHGAKVCAVFNGDVHCQVVSGSSACRASLVESKESWKICIARWGYKGIYKWMKASRNFLGTKK